MAHINLPPTVPGILGPLTAYPETARHLSSFTQELLRGKSSLTPAERELIASYVSKANGCNFCMNSHLAATRELWPKADRATVEKVVLEGEKALITDKLQALLDLAAAVQRGGKNVTPEHIRRARSAGADDKAIHDTVLIAAAFCMFNRYVDGLDTWTPDDPNIYAQIGEVLATRGYDLTAIRPVA
jgi:uncharacterized peroxidase-related enzyme